MEKVAIYASFKNQNTKSISKNLEELVNYCIMKNYDYSIYFDKVKNRLNLNRKELNNLKEKIKNKDYSKIIIKDITQLSRNSHMNYNFIKFLKKNDCGIECLDGFDVELYSNLMNLKDREER